MRLSGKIYNFAFLVFPKHRRKIYPAVRVIIMETEIKIPKIRAKIEIRVFHEYNLVEFYILPDIKHIRFCYSKSDPKDDAYTYSLYKSDTDQLTVCFDNVLYRYGAEKGYSYLLSDKRLHLTVISLVDYAMISLYPCRTLYYKMLDTFKNEQSVYKRFIDNLKAVREESKEIQYWIKRKGEEDFDVERITFDDKLMNLCLKYFKIIYPYLKNTVLLLLL